jgi:hypothetical protein
MSKHPGIRVKLALPDGVLLDETCVLLHWQVRIETGALGVWGHKIDIADVLNGQKLTLEFMAIEVTDLSDDD